MQLLVLTHSDAAADEVEEVNHAVRLQELDLLADEETARVETRDCGLLGRNGFADGKGCCCCCRGGSLVVLGRRNELSGLCWDLSLRKLSEVCHVCCGGDGVVSCQLTMLAQKPLTIVFLAPLPTSLDRI